MDKQICPVCGEKMVTSVSVAGHRICRACAANGNTIQTALQILRDKHQKKLELILAKLNETD